MPHPGHGFGRLSQTASPDGAPSMEVWNRTIAVHLTGSYNMVRLAANDMARLEPAETRSV